jgi:uncharacterized protein YecE (DUF72 family)
VGTSGWHYNHWKTVFYPETITSSAWLSYYTKRFATVEINNCFYQMPAKDTLQLWRDTAPADFVFSVKASRYITHMKKLKDPREPVNRFMASINVLGKKLGPVLFQLPPKWKVTADFVYIRLHGPARAYQGSYDQKTLAGWVGAMASWADQGRKIYCYFDNDQHGYAAQNALMMKNMKESNHDNAKNR